MGYYKINCMYNRIIRCIALHYWMRLLNDEFRAFNTRYYDISYLMTWDIIKDTYTLAYYLLRYILHENDRITVITLSK
jgi:hypothetical protein